MPAVNFHTAIIRARRSSWPFPSRCISGKDLYLEELRAKIKEAERLKLQSHQLDTQANILLEKTQEDLVEKNLVTGEQPKLFDRWFDMVEGTEAIIELTTNKVKDQGYGQAPDYEMISRIALDRNPHFCTTYRVFESEAISGILARARFMIIRPVPPWRLSVRWWVFRRC